MKEKLVEWRRYLHEHAEGGKNLVLTSNYVKAQLESMGYEVSECSTSGLVCLVGNKEHGNVLLLRADMDALPMKEKNNLSFQSKSEYSHCCGHDIHTAMLLGTAMCLKEQEEHLKGVVKFMFQPDEEGGGGAKAMMEKGVLENPKPDAVFAMHVDAKSPLGRINYGLGSTFASNDNMDIIINGKSCHGARPHEGIDPINIAVQLYNALQSSLTREKNPMKPVIFSVTSIQSGNAYNVIPECAIMKASLRAYDEETRNQLLNRFEEICKKLGEMYCSEISMEVNHSIPPMVTGKEFTQDWIRYAKEEVGENHIGEAVIKMGSEDFSFITNQYENAAYLFLGAGQDEERGGRYGQHMNRVVFNEDCMEIGVNLMVNGSKKWLERSHLRRVI